MANWLRSLTDDQPQGRAFAFLGEAADGEHLSFDPNEHYLRLRATVMKLGTEATGGAEYSPMLIVDVAGIFPHEPTSLIRVAGRGDSEEQATGHLEVINKLLVDFAPYAGDGITLKLTLYRVKTGDMVQRLFEMFDRVAEGLGTNVLGPYKDIGEVLSKELSGLLYGGKLKPLLSFEHGFSDAQFEPGFLIYAATGFDELSGYLDDHPRAEKETTADWVERIFRRTQPTWDYCVIQIERHADRQDVTKLAFHRALYEQVLPLIRNGATTRAKLELETILHEISLSKLLTPRQQRELPPVYIEMAMRGLRDWRAQQDQLAQLSAVRGGVLDLGNSPIEQLERIAEQKGITPVPFLLLKNAMPKLLPEDDAAAYDILTARTSETLAGQLDQVPTDDLLDVWVESLNNPT